MAANQMERKKVTIHITNVIRQMDAEEKSDMSVSGVFYRDKGNRYLHYEEKQLAGTIRTVLKIADNELLLMRSGAVNMRMHFFRDNRRSTASVDSGAGKLQLESELVSMEELYENKPDVLSEVAFQYDLLSHGEYIGSYTVLMKIEEDAE
ncbi:TPA: DUF1934 domain-containing protein [Listeria monocytogenes]|nr:DUF1934 domain-containing protein [Listeria monocytogenes]